MAAYVISEVEVLDEESFQQYRELARASIEQHGGRYLVRAALPEAAEGRLAVETTARHSRVSRHGHFAPVVLVGGLRQGAGLPGPGADAAPGLCRRRLIPATAKAVPTTSPTHGCPTSGRSDTRTRCGPRAPRCGWWCRTLDMAPPPFGIHRCVAGRARTTAGRGRPRAGRR